MSAGPGAVARISTAPGGWTVRWNDGPPSPPGDPRMIGREPIEAALAANTEEARLRVGQHLWSFLAPPIGVDRAPRLRIESDDAAILALPWELLADGGLWLLHLGGSVALDDTERSVDRPPVPLGSHARIVATPARYEDLSAWAGTPESSALAPRITLTATLPELAREAADADALLVRLGRGAGAPVPLADGSSLTEKELLGLLRDPPPRLVILECHPDDRERTRALAVRLAPRVRGLVLVAQAGGPDGPDETGSASRRLLGHMMQGWYASEAAARYATEAQLTPADWPIIFGEAGPGRLPDGGAPGGLSGDPYWRVRLDRTQAVDTVNGAVARLAEVGGEGAILVWWGDPNQEPGRLHQRLRWHFTHPASGSARHYTWSPVELRWPRRSTPIEADFLRMYREALGGDLATLRERGSAASSPLLYLDHGVLDSEAVEDERVSADILARYLEWWVRTVLPVLPDDVTVLLGLGFELQGDAGWLADLEARADDPGWLRPMRPVILPRLEDVKPRHIDDVLAVARVIESEPERLRVARAIHHFTKGRYAETIHAIEGAIFDRRPWLAYAAKNLDR